MSLIRRIGGRRADAPPLNRLLSSLPASTRKRLRRWTSDDVDMHPRATADNMCHFHVMEDWTEDAEVYTG